MKKKDEKSQAESNTNVRIGGNATGNAIGQSASVKASIIAGGNVNQDDQIGKLFDQVLAAINVRPVDPKHNSIIEVFTA